MLVEIIDILCLGYAISLFEMNIFIFVLCVKQWIDTLFGSAELIQLGSVFVFPGEAWMG